MEFHIAACLALFLSAPLGAAEYHVDGAAAGASDANPGTAALPWKTVGRAGSAKELRPGDTVWIHAGVYRETAAISVSGEPGRPITFAAAPRARVVIKGSEVVRGPWSRFWDGKDPKAPPVPNARRIWKVRLGEEFFADARFAGAYADRSRRWVSQVFLDDDHPLQLIGPDRIYPNGEMGMLTAIGSGLADMIPQSFFFDATDGTLYVCISGEPAWFSMEVGVRGFALTASKVHDVTVRGLEMRHNRQPGGQWSLVSLGECRKVVLEDCRVLFADFSGLSLFKCVDCAVRRCDLSWNGCTGMGLSLCEDCAVEGCFLSSNNYRRFDADWGVAAGMKCIPGNRRVTVRGCEAAFNEAAEGIWFDTDNEDIRILENVVHDNGDCGIFYEINRGGGVIAGNLVYGNRGRGIYVSGSQKVWVVRNTVVENAAGIVAMTRGKDEPPRDVRVLDNLLVRNYVTADTVTRGSDITLETSANPAARAALGTRSDHNVLADDAWTPLLRHNWNDGHPLEEWRRLFGQDEHSRRMPVPYERTGTRFVLRAGDELDVAGPLPPEVEKVWRPRNPRRVGADIVAFP